METKKFEFKGKEVTFETEKGNVMVNATEMAKPFGKEVSGFLKTDNTKRFIEAFCQTEDLPFGDEFSTNGKLIKIQKGGDNPCTWMDRRVALKFAAWLDPYFEVWIYNIVDELLFGSYKEDEEILKDIAEIQTKISAKEEAMNKNNNPIQLEIDELRKEESKAKRKLDLRKKMKINNYRSMFTAEEMEGENKE